MSGFYLMHRGWQDNPIFGREPFSRRDAWVWLIENAAFVPTRVGVGGKTIEVKRGQLCHSLRWLGRAWGWDDAKVRRFLSRAEVEKMIECVADVGQTVITICNYEQYQTIERVADAPPDAATTQQRRSGDAKYKEDNEDIYSEVADATSAHPDPKRVIFVEIANWLSAETGRPLPRIKEWLGKVAREYGDGELINAASRIRAGPYQNDYIAAITAELKRSQHNGKPTRQSPATAIFAGAALALADRAGRHQRRPPEGGTDLDPTEPLLDG